MQGVFTVAVAMALIALAAGKAPFPVPKFNCSVPLSPPPPYTNAASITPGMVSAVFALGDSITAGFAMEGTFPEAMLEYRGKVFSIGGDKDELTMPNVLAHYTTGLTGMAKGVTHPLDKGKYLDAAISGETVDGIVSEVGYIASAIKSDYPEIHLGESVLLGTLFIGANDVCRSCYHMGGNLTAYGEYYRQQLTDSLSAVQTALPRTFLNVVTLFNVSGVYVAGQASAYCRDVVFKHVQGECGCMEKYGWQGRVVMGEAALLFNAITAEVVAAFQGDPDFEPVIQPMFSGIDIGFWGEDYLSKLDCFHPDHAANEAFSIGLWRNMFLPPAAKQTTLNVTADDYIYCPEEGQVFM